MSSERDCLSGHSRDSSEGCGAAPEEVQLRAGLSGQRAHDGTAWPAHALAWPSPLPSHAPPHAPAQPQTLLSSHARGQMPPSQAGQLQATHGADSARGGIVPGISGRSGPSLPLLAFQPPLTFRATAAHPIPYYPAPFPSIPPNSPYPLVNGPPGSFSPYVLQHTIRAPCAIVGFRAPPVGPAPPLATSPFLSASSAAPCARPSHHPPAPPAAVSLDALSHAQEASGTAAAAVGNGSHCSPHTSAEGSGANASAAPPRDAHQPRAAAAAAAAAARGGGHGGGGAVAAAGGDGAGSASRDQRPQGRRQRGREGRWGRIDRGQSGAGCATGGQQVGGEQGGVLGERGQRKRECVYGGRGAGGSGSTSSACSSGGTPGSGASAAASKQKDGAKAGGGRKKGVGSEEEQRLRQAEKKKRRLEKALATANALRSELLEKRKQRRREQELWLDRAGQALAEAVALRVLVEEEEDEDGEEEEGGEEGEERATSGGGGGAVEGEGERGASSSASVQGRGAAVTGVGGGQKEAGDGCGALAWGSMCLREGGAHPKGAAASDGGRDQRAERAEGAGGGGGEVSESSHNSVHWHTGRQTGVGEGRARWLEDTTQRGSDTVPGGKGASGKAGRRLSRAVAPVGPGSESGGTESAGGGKREGVGCRERGDAEEDEVEGRLRGALLDQLAVNRHSLAARPAAASPAASKGAGPAAPTAAASVVAAAPDAAAAAATVATADLGAGRWEGVGKVVESGKSKRSGEAARSGAPAGTARSARSAGRGGPREGEEQEGEESSKGCEGDVGRADEAAAGGRARQEATHGDTADALISRLLLHHPTSSPSPHCSPSLAPAASPFTLFTGLQLSELHVAVNSIAAEPAGPAAGLAAGIGEWSLNEGSLIQPHRSNNGADLAEVGREGPGRAGGGFEGGHMAGGVGLATGLRDHGKLAAGGSRETGEQEEEKGTTTWPSGRGTRKKEVGGGPLRFRNVGSGGRWMEAARGNELGAEEREMAAGMAAVQAVAAMRIVEEARAEAHAARQAAQEAGGGT
ncbi:unnamed protein product [Closterium sp. Naga37s-1]|nr:unnamed protein product [Closterium sp. Naga37s-1]